MICIWPAANGRAIPIQAMEVDHIEKVLGVISRGNLPSPWGGFSAAEWKSIFETELRRRARSQVS